MSTATEEMTKKMVTLKTRDDQEFTVEKSVAEQCVTIKNMMEDLDECFIPLPNVDSTTLAKVIEYLKIHATTTGKDELKKFDKEYFDGMAMEKIYDVILAANYLNIKGLLDLSFQYVADHVKNKSSAYIRKVFKVKNDFTKEEEEAIVKEHAWAHEGVDPDDD